MSLSQGSLNDLFATQPAEESAWFSLLQNYFSTDDIDGIVNVCVQMSEHDFHRVFQSLRSETRESYVQLMFDQAERHYPTSALLWYDRINRSMTHSKDDETPLNLFHRCKDLVGNEGHDIWSLVYTYILLFFDDIRLEQFLVMGAKCRYPLVSRLMRWHFLNFILDKKSTADARNIFDVLAVEPNDERFYRRMLTYERGLERPKVQRVRMAFYWLCLRYSKPRNWIDFIRFEKGSGNQLNFERLILHMKNNIGLQRTSSILVEFTREAREAQGRSS